MASVIEKIEALHCRLQKAKGIVADNRVKPVLGMPEHYVVESSTGEGHYLVNDTCSCPDAAKPLRINRRPLQAQAGSSSVPGCQRNSHRSKGRLMKVVAGERAWKLKHRRRR